MSKNLPPLSKQSKDSKVLLQQYQQQQQHGDRHQYERNMINQTQTMNTIHERIQQNNDHQVNYQNQHVQRNDDAYRHYQHYEEARHDDNYQQQQQHGMITQHYQPNVNNEGKRKKKAQSSSRDGKIGRSNEHVATGAPGNYSNHFINYQHHDTNNNNNGNNGLLRDHSKITVIENQSQHAVFPMSDLNTNNNNNIGNTFTFHTAVINKEKKKRKKKEVLEGCNHFKIMNNSSSMDANQQVDSNDETVHVEKNSKKRKGEKQVQVSSFDLLSMTDNNAMFGVFKKKPSQQAYETVLHFNGGASSSVGDGQFKPPVPSTNTTQNIAQSESSQQPVITTPSPIHNPSSNSSSPSITNISQQVTFPNPIISNNSSIGFNTYSHNVNQPSSSSGVLTTTTPSMYESIQQSSGHITTLPQAIIGPSGSQPKRDFSNLNYGTITRSSNFQSATDLLFSEKQNVKQDPTNGTVTNHLTKEIELPTLSNCNQQNCEPSSSSIIPTTMQSSSNIVKNNAINSSIMIASHSSPRTIIPSIKELFK